MQKKFRNAKNSIRKKETTNKREMDSPTIRIAPDLESIERNRVTVHGIFPIRQE